MIWSILIRKFVEKKQAKLGAQLLALTLRNKFVIAWIIIVSGMVLL